jgi:catechol 2,3-dioxygenase
MLKHEQPIERPSYGIAPSGFRLPDGSHVGAVHLQVGQLQRSIDYYEHVLGLRTLDRTNTTALLGATGAERVLVSLQADGDVRPVPREGRYGLYHFAILLPDRAALGRFIAHLSRIGARVGAADHLVSEALYLTDPDGLGIEVYADRPRSAWQLRGRELAMSTEPLDMQSVVSAGGGREWDGAPEGTAIGHVHLHVGDLNAAEAFYHSALGFDKTVWSYPGALFFSAGGYHHHLGTNTWSPGPAAANDQARLLAWELVLPGADDTRAAARSLQAAGFSTEETAAGWTTADPWGTTVRIMPAAR